MKSLVVRPAEDDIFAACACCAGDAGVRGFVFEGGEPRAIYFVEAVGLLKFPLIKLGMALGDWDEAARTEDRAAFVLLCKPTPEGLNMEPAELELDAFHELSLMGERVSAADLANHPRLDVFRETAKAIIDQDWRLAPIKGGEPTVPHRKFSADEG